MLALTFGSAHGPLFASLWRWNLRATSMWGLPYASPFLHVVSVRTNN